MGYIYHKGNEYDVQQLFYGNRDVKEVWLGNKLAWESESIAYVDMGNFLYNWNDIVNIDVVKINSEYDYSNYINIGEREKIYVSNVFNNNFVFYTNKKYIGINAYNVNFYKLNTINNCVFRINNAGTRFGLTSLKSYNTIYMIDDNSNNFNMFYNHYLLVGDVVLNKPNNLSNSFCNCQNLLNVKIKDTNFVTNCSNAFNNCRNLNKYYMFNNCDNFVNAYCNTNITYAIIPNNAVNLSYTFRYCNNLISYDYSDNTNKITDMSYIFCNCRNLTEAKVPNYFVNKYNLAFYNCKNLKKLPNYIHGFYLNRCFENIWYNGRVSMIINSNGYFPYMFRMFYGSNNIQEIELYFIDNSIFTYSYDSTNIPLSFFCEYHNNNYRISFHCLNNSSILKLLSSSTMYNAAFSAVTSMSLVNDSPNQRYYNTRDNYNLYYYNTLDELMARKEQIDLEYEEKGQ